MSDDDRDIDIDSDFENDLDLRGQSKNNGAGGITQAEKRAHHNALERKRRDHIKDSFNSLKDAVPALQTEKVARRAQILKKAAEYIQFMRRKNNAHMQDIEDLKRQNHLLEIQIQALEKVKQTGEYVEAHAFNFGVRGDNVTRDSDSSGDDDEEETMQRVKKLKINGN